MTVIAKEGRACQLFICNNIKEGMPSRQDFNSNIISYFEIFKIFCVIQAFCFFIDLVSGRIFHKLMATFVYEFLQSILFEKLHFCPKFHSTGHFFRETKLTILRPIELMGLTPNLLDRKSILDLEVLPHRCA